MLPLAVLVAAGAIWPLIFRDTPVEAMRTQLNRLVMYVFFPAILFAVVASARITLDLLSCLCWLASGLLVSGALLYVLLYLSPLGRELKDSTRAVLMLGGMFGNTFNIGAPVLMFFFGRDAIRYAVFNDMLMTIPFIWSLGVWIATRLGSHESGVSYPSVWRVVVALPPLWAFALGVVLHNLDLAYAPLVDAAHMIGEATIPVTLFVLGLTIPWRNLEASSGNFDRCRGQAAVYAAHRCVRGALVLRAARRSSICSLDRGDDTGDDVSAAARGSVPP